MKNGMKVSDQELDIIFALGDVDLDGEISLSEFVRLMCPAAGSGLSKFRNSFRNIQEVVSAFKRFDTNSDGALSQQELVNGIKAAQLNMSAAEVKAIFVLADVNQDGEVNFVEFVSALFPVASDGLTKLRSSLNTLANVKASFKKLDADGDGAISFNEFKNGMLSTAKLTEGEMKAEIMVFQQVVIYGTEPHPLTVIMHFSVSL